MNEPVNLNKFRKTKARAEAKARADENAAKFGRTKAERLMDAAREEKAQKVLDQHELDHEE